MESKTFLALLIGIQALVILLGIYFIASYTSTQNYVQYQENQLQADTRFNASQVNHNNQTGVITNEISHLNYRLDPILDQVPNATQSRLDQELHYNQTAEDFNKIGRVLEIKLQDHVTVIQTNATVNKILEILGNQTGQDTTVENITDPIPAPVIENVTEPIPGPIVVENDSKPLPLPNPGLNN